MPLKNLERFFAQMAEIQRGSHIIQTEDVGDILERLTSDAREKHLDTEIHLDINNVGGEIALDLKTSPRQAGTPIILKRTIPRLPYIQDSGD